MTIVPENEYIKKNRIIIGGEDNALIDNLERKILFPVNEKVDEKSQTELLDRSATMPSFNPCRTSRKCSVLFVASLLGFIMGIVLVFAMDPLVQKILAYKLVIVEGREGHRFWKDPPANVHRKMYIWHCSNPQEVLDGAIPEFIERGPYVYREEWNRSNIFYADDLDTLSYIPITTLFFDRNQSIGPDDEYVSVINIPLLAMAHQIQFNPPIVQESVNFLLQLLQTQLFVNVTVKQLMEGYTDPLIEAASIVKPGVLKDNKFGILQPRNGSYYQNFTIHTGFNDITQAAKVISFNGLKILNYWSTPQANMLNGTDASLFPPNLRKDQLVYSYNADMCRSYHLTYLRERKDGLVPLYDFHLSSDIFNMSRPENQGFCGKEKCYGDGVLNISTCYQGVWGFISSPHFFQADKKFLEDVHGMNPDPSKHEFIMSFEPLTSVPFAVNVRLQLSFYLPQISKIDLFKSVRPILVPIVWFDDEARLHPDVHSELSTLVISLNAVYYIKYILVSISLLMIFISVIYIFVQWRNTRHERVNSNAPLLSGTIET